MPNFKLVLHPDTDHCFRKTVHNMSGINHVASCVKVYTWAVTGEE